MVFFIIFYSISSWQLARGASRRSRHARRGSTRCLWPSGLCRPRSRDPKELQKDPWLQLAGRGRPWPAGRPAGRLAEPAGRPIKMANVTHFCSLRAGNGECYTLWDIPWGESLVSWAILSSSTGWQKSGFSLNRNWPQNDHFQLQSASWRLRMAFSRFLAPPGRFKSAV